MPTNQVVIHTSPERVFEVLTDPTAYGDWVVGARAIGTVDDGWPAPGTGFHGSVGVGPFAVGDRTEVREIDPPRRLVLHAQARALGSAIIDLILTACEEGTLVTMIESPTGALSRASINPLTDPLVRLRNAESLRRLRWIAESDGVKG